MVGLFNGPVKESIEMLYQSRYEYLFDSSKFERAFKLPATGYDKGILETVASMKHG
jgi:hypothetical protein